METPRQKGLFYCTAFCIAIITLSLGIYPKEGLTAAKEGLRIFAEVVLPSLLPFFILTEILLGLGVVHFIGVFLEPLMRPAFNVPGAGAFALSMGLAAGYPMDAVITAKFRQLKLCTQLEGERLLAFTNTADPLFMFGAVAVGMFGYPEIGVTIAIAHYLAAFSVGFIFRFYGKARGQARSENRPEGNILRRAAREMLKARREDNRPFGQLLADAVKDSISTLLMIGGFIVLFSVLYQVLEIDLGTMAAAQTKAALGDKLIVSAVVIAWSGLSVLGQVISVIHGTDLRIWPFISARVLHGLIAGLYTYLLLGTVKVASGVVPALQKVKVGPLNRWYLSFAQLLMVTGMLLVAGLLMRFLSGYRLVCLKKVGAKKRNRGR
jgi:nucleoside recognition membrane protein YjiH